MRWRVVAGVVTATPVVGFLGLYIWLANPGGAMEPLPAFAVPFAGDAGQAILRGAMAADLRALTRSFQAQEKRSWCGVASAVTVLAALRGEAMTQDGLFTAGASAVRSWWAVTFGGMSLEALAGLLRAHGVEVELHRADEGAEAFRQAVASNAAHGDDYLLVNWQRSVLGQEGEAGHISPIGAYDVAGDRVLVLDVAAYRYPWAWFPLARMFAAMDTRDGDALRGWLVVRRVGGGAAAGG